MIVYTSADSVLQICGNEETLDWMSFTAAAEDAQGADFKG